MRITKLRVLRIQITSDLEALSPGLVQSLFEGSLHLFSFLWTPTIFRAAGANILSHGHIFAAIMLSTFIGSSASGFVEKTLNMKSYYWLLLAACGLSLSEMEPDNFKFVFPGLITFGVSFDIC